MSYSITTDVRMSARGDATDAVPSTSKGRPYVGTRFSFAAPISLKGLIAAGPQPADVVFPPVIPRSEREPEPRWASLRNRLASIRETARDQQREAKQAGLSPNDLDFLQSIGAL